MEWTQAVAALMPGEVVAIDGKTVRRSHDKRAGKQAQGQARKEKDVCGCTGRSRPVSRP